MNISQNKTLASLLPARAVTGEKKQKPEMAKARVANLAKKKLEEIADDFLWSADDLIDWFQNDYEKIAHLTFNETKELVTEYLSNIRLHRGDNSHMAKMIDPYYRVACRDCQHWTPDTIGGYGIGDCPIHDTPVPPAYPGAKRRCFEYQEI